LKEALIGWMEKMDSGLISRNRHFDLFKRKQVLNARTSLARIRAIREKMRSPSWDVSFSKKESGLVAVTMKSRALAVTWKTTLSQSEYDFL